MAEFSSIERQTDLTVDKTRYISDDQLRSLRIWKERVRRFFSKDRSGCARLSSKR